MGVYGKRPRRQREWCCTQDDETGMMEQGLEEVRKASCWYRAKAKGPLATFAD